MKKILTCILVVIMSFALTIPAWADPGTNNGKGNSNGNQTTTTLTSAPTVVPLHQQNDSPIAWQSYSQGSDFGINANKGEDKLVSYAVINDVPLTLDSDGAVLWHFVNPDKLGGYADITFIDDQGKEVTISGVVSYKNDQHFAVVTPDTWTLLRAEYYPTGTVGKNGTLFNLSSTFHHPAKTPKLPETGSLVVSASVNKQHEVDTYQPIRQELIQPIWQKTIQPWYQKTYQPVWQKTIQPWYQKTFREVLQDTTTTYYDKNVVDVTAGDSTKTLVSKMVDGGGAWNNGFTWVPVNVAAAEEGPVQYEIADSSPSNRDAGIYYNVQIEGNMMHIWVPDNVYQANIGGYVYNTVPSKFPHAPKHTGLSADIPMPANYGDVVYLFFHNQGGIYWTTGEQTTTYTVDPTKTTTTTAVIDPKEFVSEAWVKDTVVKDQLVRKDTVSDQLVKNEVLSNELVDSKSYDYLVRNQFVGSEMVDDTFNVIFNLTVTNTETGEEVYNGDLGNNLHTLFPALTPGNYTCVLSGNGVDATKTVDVVAGQQATVDFNDLATVIGSKVTVITKDDPKYLPVITLPKIYTTPIIKDIKYMKPINLEKTYLDPITLHKKYTKIAWTDPRYEETINVSVGLPEED